MSSQALISYAEALQLLQESAAQRRSFLPLQLIPTNEALGFRAAEEVLATEPNPRFTNSAMDGFALCAASTEGASAAGPVPIKVLGQLAAGAGWEQTLGENARENCLEITTGAPLPSQFDAVLRLEDSERINDRQILAKRAIRSGENVRFAGSDIAPGDRLLKKGEHIGPAQIMALAISGIREVQIFSRPRVVLLCTGDELVSFDAAEVPANKIRNSNLPFLLAALRQMNVEVSHCETIPDNPLAIGQALMRAVEAKPHLIITTGGVSVGSRDYLPQTLAELRAKTVFHKVAVRPGKPVLFAEFPGVPTALFGLPGNPMSVAAGLRFFVEPFFRSLLAAIPQMPLYLPLAESLQKPQGLTFFMRAEQSGHTVRALPGQASFAVQSFLQATGWILTPAHRESLNQGELVEYCPLCSSK